MHIRTKSLSATPRMERHAVSLRVKHPVRPQRRKRIFHTAWSLALLAGFLACLSNGGDPPVCEGEGDTACMMVVGAGETTESGNVASGVQSITIPDGGIIDTEPSSGWTEGSFSVSDSGSAEYDLPIWVPRGRAGIEPSLGFHYSSSGGNGLVGVGWSVTGLSAITHCSRTLAQDGYIANPRYDSVHGSDTAYCLDGQRLRPTGGESRGPEFRTERDQFARISASYQPFPTGGPVPQPDSFTVKTKGGQILTYGGVDGARLRAYPITGIQPENPTFLRQNTLSTVVWALSRVEDRNGNSVDIAYERIAGTQANMWGVEFVPKQITYAPNRKVEFVYEDRTDKIDTFLPGQAGGVHIKVPRRLKTIRVFGPALLREYRVAYRDPVTDGSSITGRSLLKSITECDPGTLQPWPPTLPVCMAPVEFDWSLGSNTFDVVDTNVTDAASSSARWALWPADFNGDGATDLLYGNPQNNWRLRLGGGAGAGTFGAAQSAGLPSWDDANRVPQIRLIDFDRDDRMDAMIEVHDTDDSGNPITKLRLYRSTGTDFSGPGSWTDPLPASKTGGGPLLFQGFFGDIDGNGLPDYLAPKLSADRTELTWRYRLNLGSSWGGIIETDLITEGPPVIGNPPGVDPTYQIRATSLDGLMSQFVVWNSAAGKYDGIRYLGGVGGIDLSVDFTTGLNIPFDAMYSLDRREGQFVDINGDGLEDIVYPCSGLKAQLNGGRGFSPIIAGPTDYSHNCPNPVPFFGADLSVRIADFNSDGAGDVLILNSGTSCSTADFSHCLQLYTWRGGGFVRVPLMRPYGEQVQANQPGDFNGDGLTDIVQLGRTGSSTFLRVLKHAGDVPDRLIRVKVAGLGDRVEVEYKTLAQTTPCTDAAYPLVCPRTGGRIVATHRLATGLNDQFWRWFTHGYANARMDLRGRGILGFESHTVTSSASAGPRFRETTFDNKTSQMVGPAQVYPLVGLAKTVRDRLVIAQSPFPHPEVEQTSTRSYEVHVGTVPGVHSVRPKTTTYQARETSSVPDAWLTLRSSQVSIDEYDDFDNPKKITTTSASLTDTTTVEYHPNDADADWVIGKPKRVTTKSCTAAQECQTRVAGYDFDPVTTNLTRTTVEPDDAPFLLTTEFGYDSFGNIETVTTSDADGEERMSSIEYDANGLFPKSFTNALDHVTEVTIDQGLGVPTSGKDANLVPTTMKWDRLGRLREVNNADGSYVQIHNFGPLAKFTTVPDGAGGTRTGMVIAHDKLGRVIGRQTLAFDGQWTGTETKYDHFGRVTTVSEPHYLASGTPVYNTTYEYDGRDRLIKTTAPDDVVTTRTYIGREIHFFDGMGVESYVLSRLDGLIDSRYEDDPKSTNWLKTQFEYGPFQLLKKTTAADGTVQTTTYDKLGRPKTSTDPSSGTSQTTYDAFSEIISTTDGAGNTTTVVDRDLLGRATLVTSPDGDTEYVWDSVANGKGLLGSATSPDGVVTSYAYNAKGQTTSVTQNIDGASYQFNGVFDDIGRLKDLTYPAIPGASARLKVTYNYNLFGYLKEVADAASGGTRFWRADARDAAGRLRSEDFGVGGDLDGDGVGDGVWRGHRHYTTGAGLLAGMQLFKQAGGQQIDNLVYDYDNNRNVDQRWDQVGTDARRHTYTYDTLNRLETWTVFKGNQDFQTTYDYDKFNNLISETVTGRTGRNVTYQYTNAAHPYWLTQRNGATNYAYDGAGRQKTAPGRTVTFTTFNLPKAVTSGGQVTDFVYDAGGGRVVKSNSGEVDTAVGPFERRVGTNARNIHTIMADGRAVAQVIKTQTNPTGPVTSTETLFLHTDGQGSLIQATKPDGTVAEEFFYDPFGRRTDKDYDYLTPQLRPQRIGYTGHDHDDELDLINMQGREYDPLARRFISPDPFVAPLFSQSYNPYTYVWNNPATYTDPSGFRVAVCRWESGYVGSCPEGGGGDEGGFGGGSGGGWGADSVFTFSFGFGFGGSITNGWGYAQTGFLPSGLGWPPNRPNRSCPISGPCGTGNGSEPPLLHGSDGAAQTNGSGGGPYVPPIISDPTLGWSPQWWRTQDPLHRPGLTDLMEAAIMSCPQPALCAEAFQEAVLRSFVQVEEDFGNLVEDAALLSAAGGLGAELKAIRAELRGIKAAGGIVPRGFASAEQFGQARSELQAALKSSGITDATIGVRGSAVTGTSFRTGAPFGPASDIDFFAESAQLTSGLKMSRQIPGFVHPDRVAAAFPELASWAKKWSQILGREVTVGGFAPGAGP